MLQDVTAPIEQFAKLINVNLGTVVRRITMDLFNRITQRTPVKTGRARSSWQVSENTIPNTVPAPGTYSGPSAIAAAAAAAVSGTTVIYIVSNLDYIEPLENGHSAQAPAGMVTLSIAEVVAEIKLHVKKLQ